MVLKVKRQDDAARGQSALWHPFTPHSAQAAGLPVITRGRGVFLYDTAGRRWLDAISSWWACNLGHSHPRLVRAIRRQAGRLQHSILGHLSHPEAIGLAEDIAALFPGPGWRVFFASDGASAVEAALKIAVQYWHNLGQPRRQRLVSLAGAYHGDTLGAVSVGRCREFHRAFRPLLFPVYRARAPFCAACAPRRTPDNCALECLASLAAILERHGDRVAAVIVEPLCQCATGMRIYAPACLARLAALCRRHGALLIADEIATGFGRTGRMFACQHAGVRPDIVCLGKGLSGGCLPISATVVRAGIYRAFSDRPADRTFYHGHTFAGNPLAAAAARATLKIYRAEGMVARAAQLGRVLASALEPCRALPQVRRLRSLGLIAAFDLVDRAGRPDAGAARAVRRAMLARGVLIRPLGATVYLLPPLVISEKTLVKLAADLYRSVREL